LFVRRSFDSLSHTGRSLGGPFLRSRRFLDRSDSGIWLDFLGLLDYAAQMRKIILVVVVVLLAWPMGSYLPSVRADQDVTTGTWLLGACELSLKATDHDSHVNVFDAYRDGYCRGLTRGIGAASPFVCLPGEVAGEQEVRVVTKYLEDHPKELQLSGTRLTERALSEAFPCKQH
jgi:hypothetical protein